MRQMNGGDFRKAFGFVAVGLMGLGASAIDITEDTTVTGADIASYATAAINIADGKTLTLSNPDKSYTFTGALSGSGNFVCTRSSATADIRMTFNSSNAQSFTGGIYITNLVFTVKSPASIGNASQFTVNSMANYAWCFLEGSGVYACPFDVTIYDGTQRGLQLSSADTEISGPVTWRKGRLIGPGKVTGKITSYNWFYAVGSVHLAGGVNFPSGSYKFSNDGSSCYLDSAVTGSGDNYINAGVIYCGCNNAFGSRYTSVNGSPTIDLGGYDQDIVLDSSANVTVTSEKPATLKMRTVWYDRPIGNLKGAASLYFDPQKSNAKMSLAGKNNTTTGTVTTVWSGQLTLKDGVTFTREATLSVSASTWGTPRLIVPASATVTAKKSTLSIKESGLTTGNAKVNVGADGLLIVREAYVNGVQVKAGDYTASTDASASALSKHMTGTGTIRVLTPAGLSLIFR